jgi:hypothetical protein
MWTAGHGSEGPTDVSMTCRSHCSTAHQRQPVLQWQTVNTTSENWWHDAN